LKKNKRFRQLRNDLKSVQKKAISKADEMVRYENKIRHLKSIITRREVEKRNS